MAEEFDPFETDDSNEIGEYTAKVVTSEFTTNEEYDPDTLLLRWEMEVTGGDLNADTWNISFTCGKKFESPDGGLTAIHESGKPKGFNSQSRMGMLCHRAFYNPDSGKPAPTLGGDKEADEVEAFGLREYFGSVGKTPQDADAWVGIEFGFHQEERDYGGSIGTRQFEMPFEVISLPQVGSQKKKAPAKKAAGRKRTAPKADTPVEVDWAALKETVLDAGEETEDHAEFMKLAATFMNDIPKDAAGADEFMDWLEDDVNGAWAEYE